MKWFNNLKMIQKLVSAFILVALFIGIVGIVGIYSMRSMNKNIANIYSVDLVGLNAVDNIEVNLLKINTNILLSLDPKNKSNFKKYQVDILGLKSKNDAIIVKYKNTITTDLDRIQFAEFENLLRNYRIDREKLIRQVEEGNYGKANQLLPSVSNITTDMFIVLDKEISLNKENFKSWLW